MQLSKVTMQVINYGIGFQELNFVGILLEPWRVKPVRTQRDPRAEKIDQKCETR